MIAEMPLRAALNTTEILEKVLSFLPSFNLFRLQRVCRQWRDLIARSPSIREKMFLRVCAKTPETWMLIDTKPFDPNPDLTFRWNRQFNPHLSDQKFRMVNDAELGSGDWGSTPGRTLQLCTPVTLNPLLFAPHRFDCKSIEGSWFFRTSLKPATKLAQDSALRNTYLTNLPCHECSAIMIFDARTPSQWLESVACHAVVRSDKPLTLGDVIDQTMASHMWHYTHSWRYQRSGTLQDITLAEKIDDMDERHGCKTTLRSLLGMHIVLSLEENTFLPLVLTDAEYLRYKPVEDSSQ